MSSNPASTFNRNTNFVPKEGDWSFQQIRIKASTAIEMGTAIGIEISSNTTTGDKTKMGVENAAGADLVGILMEEVATTDADYATSGKLKIVAIPTTAACIAEFTVGAGTFTVVDEGKTVEFHSDSKSLAVDTAGKGARITKYLSATRGLCQFTLPTTETA